MEIVYRRRPDLYRLCLMAAGFPSWHVFKNVFTLDSENIASFISHHNCFEGKFVFDKTSKKLAANQGSDRSHRQIARTIVADVKVRKENMVGAWLTCKKTHKLFTFELSGSSGFFGEPTAAEFNEVANHIIDILTAAGLNSSRGMLNDQTIIVTLE